MLYFPQGTSKKVILSKGAGLFLGPPPQASVYIMAVYLGQNYIFGGVLRLVTLFCYFL